MNRVISVIRIIRINRVVSVTRVVGDIVITKPDSREGNMGAW
jgi:hypothetical protein